MIGSTYTMRKTIFKEEEKKPVTIETPKRPPSLDDYTIREILRGACRELDEDTSGMFMGDNIRIWVIQTLEVSSKPAWVDPEFLKDKTELLPLWGIYAQRQVLLFEQESRVVDGGDLRPLW